MRTYNNTVYPTNVTAAIAMSSVEYDGQIFAIFDEACNHMSAKQLRQYFAFYLIANRPPLANQLWNKYEKHLCDDYRDMKEDDKVNEALLSINNILQPENSKCFDFGLPEPYVPTINTHKNNTLQINHLEIFNFLYLKLNDDQKYIFDTITTKPGLYFIDSPGGTGKTYLNVTLFHYYLSQCKNVLCVAWTGIAATLLPNGMTSHKLFKFPLDLNDANTSFVKSDCDKKRLRECDVLIWDAGGTIPNKALEIANNIFQESVKVLNLSLVNVLLLVVIFAKFYL